MKASTTARITALAASAAIGLTGCGGDTRAADAKATTPAGPVAAGAPSPVATRAPAKSPPNESSAQEAAAIALVRTYVAEYNKALQSGSTTEFRKTFEETCSMCLGNAVNLDGIFRKNQRLRGLQYTLASPRVTFHNSRWIFVEGQLSGAGGQVLSSSGAVVESFTPDVPFQFLWRVKPGSSPMIVESEIR